MLPLPPMKRVQNLLRNSLTSATRVGVILSYHWGVKCLSSPTLQYQGATSLPQYIRAVYAAFKRSGRVLGSAIYRSRRYGSLTGPFAGLSKLRTISLVCGWCS
jgi:hypothetical protein